MVQTQTGGGSKVKDPRHSLYQKGSKESMTDPNPRTQSTTGPADQEIFGLKGIPVCGATFGDVADAICALPAGHTGAHVTHPKSDNIASIAWWPKQVSQ